MTFSKEEENHIEPSYVFASINKKIGGAITVKEIQEHPTILLNSKTTTIEHFEITYFDGSDAVTKKIDGNKIPQEIIREMSVSGINSTVYITRIECLSETNSRFFAPSFNFTLIKKTDFSTK